MTWAHNDSVTTLLWVHSGDIWIKKQLEMTIEMNHFHLIYWQLHKHMCELCFGNTWRRKWIPEDASQNHSREQTEDVEGIGKQTPTTEGCSDSSSLSVWDFWDWRPRPASGDGSPSLKIIMQIAPCYSISIPEMSFHVLRDGTIGSPLHVWED